MDYKTLTKEFEAIRKTLINFTSSKTKKNISRVDKLVNDYLDNIAVEKYSLKSYKAKIIHNELEHHRTTKELAVVVKDCNARLETLFTEYFKDYFDIQLGENASPTKIKDMKDFSLAHRKQRQDVINKKNSLEKEINNKNKEYDALKEEKQRIFNETILDIKSKFQANLNKVNDKTIREYSDIERKLIDVDLKKEIETLKNKIKEIRLKGLKQEYNLKVQTYEILMSEEITNFNNYEDFLLEVNTFNNINKRKIIDFDNTLNDLTLELENKEQTYDGGIELKYVDNCLKEIVSLIESLTHYNEFIQKFNNATENEMTDEDKLFIFDFITMNLYYVLVKVREHNVYDSLCNFILDIINLTKDLKKASVDLHHQMDADHQDKEKKLLVALANYTPANKRVSKEGFLENVQTSLTRYYHNFYEEIDRFNVSIFGLLGSLVKIIITKRDSLFTNDNKIGIIPKSYLFKNENYNFADLNGFLGDNGSDEIVINGETTIMTNEHKTENIIKLHNKLNNQFTIKKDNLEKILSSFDKAYKKKKHNLALDYAAKVAVNEKEARDIKTNNIKNKKDKENALKKSTRKYISNAKKLYTESINAL